MTTQPSAGNDDPTVIPDLIGDLMKKIMKEKFEYTKAIEELEAIAAKVEDPKTGIDDIDKYIKRSQELIEACRAYLRGAREKLENI